MSRQDAIKEQLFCLGCETKRLSPLERYAREEFYGAKSPLRSVPDNAFIWSGLDYARMKLFTVSLVWRMSLSRHDFYSKVEVGQKHENAMRKMLLSSDPMEPWRYGCSLAFLLYAGKPLRHVFSQPQRHHSQGMRNIYRFMLDGLAWFYHIASHPPVAGGAEGCLQESGIWIVPVVNALEIEFVRGEIERFRQYHKAKRTKDSTIAKAKRTPPPENP